MESDSSTNTSLSEAVRRGDWGKARHLAAIKVAEAMERTESARDTKALSISLNQLIDKCELGNVTEDRQETPLDRILAKADLMESEGRRPAQDGK